MGRGGRVTDADVVVILITFPIDADVDGFAAGLVDEGSAACVTVLPEVESVFRWAGSLERTKERQLLVKTTAGRVDHLHRRRCRLRSQIWSGSDIGCVSAWHECQWGWRPVHG